MSERFDLSKLTLGEQSQYVADLSRDSADVCGDATRLFNASEVASEADGTITVVVPSEIWYALRSDLKRSQGTVDRLRVAVGQS